MIKVKFSGWRLSYLVIQYHVNPMSANICSELPQEVQDILYRGCIGKTSKAYTVSNICRRHKLLR